MNENLHTVTRPKRAIVVDDDPAMREACVELLEAFGWHVRALATGLRIDATLDLFPADVILTDVQMPQIDGLQLLEKLKSRPLSPPVVLITAHGDVSMAVDAIHNGAYDFMEKPFDPHRMMATLERAAQVHEAAQVEYRLKSRLASLSNLDRLYIGESEEAQAVRRQILSVIDIDLPVLIRGDTGTGKTLLARAIHDLGASSARTFFHLNCAQIVPDRAVEMLYGVEGGREGILSEIGSGTLFISEIAACPLDTQAKLLQVADSRTFLPEGGHEIRRFEGRIISSTSARIDEEVASGGFRKDLFYRLSGFTITLPSLEQRMEDVPILFAAFVEQFAKAHRETIPEHTGEVTGALLAHTWPGNVRELRQVAERWILMRRAQPDTTVSEAIGTDPTLNNVPRTLRQATAAFEAEIIAQAIVSHKGRMDDVADHLGVPRRTLNDKMTKLGVSKTHVLSQNRFN